MRNKRPKGALTGESRTRYNRAADLSAESSPMSNPSAPSPKADLALTVFLQDVASGRRVLWIGDASTGGAERLASMALDVRVMDTSGRLRAGKVGAARVVPYSAGRLKLDGQFDLIVVPDASVLDDLNQSAEEIKRALGDGLLVLGTHADTEHYERAVPALDAAFREVRLLGQAPFTASAIANLDHEAGGVALDGSLLRDAPESIERYLFIAGDELPESDGLLVVQLPGAEPAESNEREVQALRQELNRAGARLEQAQVRLVETEATLSESRARLVSQEAASKTALADLEERAAAAEASAAEASVAEAPATPEPVQLVQAVDDGEDVSALEVKLQERGALVRSLQSEARRHALIVRDMAEELREWTRGHRGAPASDSALDTEASLAAAQFTIDELSAEVLGLKSAVASAASAPDPVSVPAEQVAPAEPDPELTRQLTEATRAVEGLEGERNGLTLRLADVEASFVAAQSATSELRAEVATLKSVPAPEPAPSPDPALVSELVEARTQLETLEGERNGLTLRLADVEASLEAASAPVAPAAAVSPSTDQLDRLDSLQEEVEALRLTNTELTISTLDLGAEKEALETRGREVSSALAARDALITRLQIDLAQEENTRALHDKQVVRMRAEVFNLREAVVAASLAVDAQERAERKVKELEAELEAAAASSAAAAASSAASLAAAAASSAAADLVELAQQEAEELSDELREVAEARDAAAARLGQVEGELGALRDHASAAEETVAGLEAFKSKATEALAAARATLAALQDQGFTPERSSITSAGGEMAPTSEADAGLETLMRSLTAQLEERDDRIRALERRVRDAGGSDSNTDALELEERADRLQEALEHERSARTAADERVIQLLKQAPVEPIDLKQKLSAKESALEETEQRVETLSVDVSSLRTVCAETRTGLESLLSDADADEEAARRIGDLLDILRGF